MEQLEYDYNIHLTPNAGDEALLVKFFMGPLQDMDATKAAGRPIFKDVEWIDKRKQGINADGVIRPVRKGDAEQFPKHYAAFKARIDKDAEEVVGTPLSVWPWPGMTKARVEELKFFNCRTVEQLANMPDNVGQPLMHFQMMKQAAKNYLETVRLSAPLARLQVLLEQATATIAEQGVTIARLHAKVHGLPEPATADVMVPMREQIKRELALVAIETPRPAEPPAPPPPPQPDPVQAQRLEDSPEYEAGRLQGIAAAHAEWAADMAKKRKAPPPPRRRPGY